MPASRSRARRAVRLALAVAGLAALTWILGSALASRLDGPLGMIPGGPFRGAAAPCPEAALPGWSAAREVEVEVWPPRPRSVTTWSVVHEGALYLPADFLTPWKRWPHQAMEDPRVRLRVAGQVFACRVERVRDPGRIAALRDEAVAKYDVEPDGLAARTEVWWFRVGPRESAAAP